MAIICGFNDEIEISIIKIVKIWYIRSLLDNTYSLYYARVCFSIKHKHKICVSHYDTLYRNSVSITHKLIYIYETKNNQFIIALS